MVKRKKDKRKNNDLYVQNISLKTKDCATGTPLKTGGILNIRRATNVTNTSWHEWGNNQIVITTNRTYMWSFVTQIFRNG